MIVRIDVRAVTVAKNDRKHIMPPYYLPVLTNISVALALVLINDVLMLVLVFVIVLMY